MSTQSLATVENPVDDKEVVLRASAQELVVTSKDVVIMTPQDLSEATDLLREIKDRYKEIETLRESITKPINQGLKVVNDRFKVMKLPLEQAEEDLKQKMVAFQRKEEARQRAENERQEKLRREEEARQRKIDEEQAAESDRAPLPPAVAERPVEVAPVAAPNRTTYGQSGAAFTVKKVWAHELIDLKKVPVEYLVLDTVKVNQAVKAGIRYIDGIRIFEKDVAQVK